MHKKYQKVFLCNSAFFIQCSLLYTYYNVLDIDPVHYFWKVPSYDISILMRKSFGNVVMVVLEAVFFI